MLGQPGIDAARATALIAEDPSVFAAGLLAEAADNDDVTSAEAALGYFEDRLRYFTGIIEPGVAAALRAEFTRRLAAWGAMGEQQ